MSRRIYFPTRSAEFPHLSGLYAAELSRKLLKILRLVPAEVTTACNNSRKFNSQDRRTIYDVYHLRFCSINWKFSIRNEQLVLFLCRSVNRNREFLIWNNNACLMVIIGTKLEKIRKRRNYIEELERWKCYKTGKCAYNNGRVIINGVGKQDEIWRIHISSLC